MRATSLLLLIAAVAGIYVYKSTAAPGRAVPHVNPRKAVVDNAAAKAAACKDAETVDCAFARGVVNMALIDAIDMAGRSRLDDILAALSSEEPLVARAAVERLSQLELPVATRDTKVLPAVAQLLATTRWLCVGDPAAHLLAGTREFATLGKHWTDHHAMFKLDKHVVDYFRPVDIPDLNALGFVLYPGATPDSAADSDRSIGFVTRDAADKVIAFYSKQAGAKVITPEQWKGWLMTRLQQDSRAHPAGSTSSSSSADVDQIRKLSEEFQRTHDPKVAQQIAALAKTMHGAAPDSAPAPAASAQPPLLQQAYALHADSKDTTTTAIIVAGTSTHVARMVFVYPEPALGGTAIELAWSLADGPSLAEP